MIVQFCNVAHKRKNITLKFDAFQNKLCIRFILQRMLRRKKSSMELEIQQMSLSCRHNQFTIATKKVERAVKQKLFDRSEKISQCQKFQKFL